MQESVSRNGGTGRFPNLLCTLRHKNVFGFWSFLTVSWNSTKCCILLLAFQKTVMIVSSFWKAVALCFTGVVCNINVFLCFYRNLWTLNPPIIPILGIVNNGARMCSSLCIMIFKNNIYGEKCPSRYLSTKPSRLMTMQKIRFCGLHFYFVSLCFELTWSPHLNAAIHNVKIVILHSYSL